MSDATSARPVETALLARDAEGRQIVSIHVKRTYQLLTSGKCARAEVQQPLLMPSPGDNEPVRETDIVPFKAATDLIVLASAYAPTRSTTNMAVHIGLGSLRWDYAVFGERRCSYRGRGSIGISKPAPFEKIPLRYENAYGGFDEHVPDPEVKTLLDALSPHPGIYPRNSAGRGYVVYENAEAIDGLSLPNTEHPGHLLGPSNLVAGRPENWWKQPLPWSCDWFDKNWYPRVTFYGGLPDHLPDDDREIAEVKLGWVMQGQNRRHASLKLEDAMNSRLGDAASPALVVPFLRGDEAIHLVGMTPNGRIVVRLPGEIPRIKLRFEGKENEILPVPNRILVSTDEMGVYIVWHGAWRTPRQLPDRLPRPGDDQSMELEGVEVFVDGQRVAPLV